MKLQPLCIAARTESLIPTRSGFEPPPAAAVWCGASPRPRAAVRTAAGGPVPQALSAHRGRCWCLCPGFKGSFDLDKQTVSPT